MPVVCFDASALVKLIVSEDGSDVAARLWDEADAVVASRLALPEVSAALSAAQRSGRLDDAKVRRARGDFEEYWSALRVVEVTAGVAEAAARLTMHHVLGGADAVHLASALTLIDADPVLAAWDARLRIAAVEAGLTVAPSG